jgi:hypothetical protein
MTGRWLDPLREALDRRTSPATIFLRDDDGGWSTDRLRDLLDVTCQYGVPVDVAVIPDAADLALARELRLRDEYIVRTHQHGLGHVNHESTGRTCEFGVSRAVGDQRNDIASGRRRLFDLLGDRVDPIFTPPWNRCTALTARCLVSLEFELLSCDIGAERFGMEELAELPVSLDWTGRRGAITGPDAWGQTIAASVGAADAPVGLMLHHAVMTHDDRTMLRQLLDVLTGHPCVRFEPMLAISRARSSRGDPWGA